VPTWLAILLLGLAAVLICQAVVAFKPPRRTIKLEDRETWALRGAWRCRLLAGLAVVVAWAQHQAYEGGPSWFADAVTGFFLVLALLLLVAAWRLTRGVLH
jgi:hypothetical protein